MKVTIDISPSGFGSVNGIGEYASGDEVTLTASNSFNQFPFLHYVIDGNEITDNPYTFTAASEDVVGVAVYNYKLFDYLRDSIGYGLEDGQIISVITNRGLDVGILNEDATIKERELCYADCLKIVLTSPDRAAYKRENWSESTGYNDKDEIINIINSIYLKYGEDELGGSIVDKSYLW